MTKKRAWVEGEPSLEDLLSDPILEFILHRDGLTLRDVWQAVDLARARLDREIREPSAAA